MKKTITAAALALTLAGAGLAFAQGNPAQSTAPRFSAEDVSAMTDARIAGLKAGLKLTPEQEKNWPAVETAIRDLAKARADRMKDRADRRAERREARQSGDHAANSAARPDMLARLRSGADAMTARADGLKKLADASEPLYKSLDEHQKRRFAMLLRASGRSGFRGHHHWMHRADSAR